MRGSLQSLTSGKALTTRVNSWDGNMALLSGTQDANWKGQLLQLHSELFC